MDENMIRILMVEDNPADRKLIEVELRRGGLQFQAIHVETESAFCKALEEQIDIVLCDWTLPQFNCMQALSIVRELDPNLPFIIVSGSIGEEAAVEAIKLGASDYLIKDRLGRLATSIRQSLVQRDSKISAATAIESLKKRELQLAEAQHVARMGSWVWKPSIGDVWWSDGMYMLFGVDSNASTPSFDLFLSLLHPDDRPTAIARVDAMMAGNHEFDDDFRVIRPDGTAMWIQSRARATRNAAGEILSVDGIDQDITERKKLHQKLFQAQKMEAIGRLAGGIAHDFNNILTVIMGYSEILLAQYDKSDRSVDSLRQINEAGQRAAELTGQLLAFGRKSIVQTKVLNLNTLINNLSKMLRPLIGEDIELVLKLAPNIYNVEADPCQMEQVLVNLIVNARDAMPQGGVLTISTSVYTQVEKSFGISGIKEGLYVKVCVTDNGCGMPAEILDQVFEPFFTTKDVGHGTGLGLATAYGIVEHSGGTIEVQSDVGVGTTFTIFFPAVTMPPTNTTPDVNLLTALRGTETVLLVEDEAPVLKLVQTILESQGYAVHATSEKSKAIEIATHHAGEIDILVTDVVMPYFSGRGLAEIVRKLRPNIRVLYMSGYTDDAVLRYGVESGSSSFLQKPITPQSLARKVRETLDLK